MAYELPDGSAVVQPGRGVLLCATSGEMVWLVEDQLLAEEPGRSPNLLDLATVVTAEILRRSGCFLAHAGAIGRQGRCLLLTGESGSGKTTLTMREVVEGWDFYGDDMVIVGRGLDGRWRVHPFWRPVHLTPHSLDLLGGLRVGSTETSLAGKVRCDITDLLPVNRPSPGLIEAVLCLRPGWHPAVPQQLSQAHSLPALGATFLSGCNLRNAEIEIENLLEFLGAVRIYEASWSADSRALTTLLHEPEASADLR